MNFSIAITNWYKLNKRIFPWRNTKNPYYIWLSEIILQQTRTLQGLPYYNKFITKFATVKKLALADEFVVLKLWQGLGYYSRARNLHATAKFIHTELNNEFPNNYKGLLKLKGIGDYTASAIASICFDEKCAVVDGNVYRVLSRYFGVKTPINSSKGIKEFKILAQSLLPKNNFGLHNQAIMDFGATICTPKKANCDTCIFNDSCFALQNNKVYDFPVKTSKTKIRKRFFNYLVILSKNETIAIVKRENRGIWQNLYEFPLIESEKEISQEQLILHPVFKQWIKTNYQITLYNEKAIVHKLSHQHIYTNFWIVNYNDSIANAIKIENLKNYPVPTLIDNFINKIKF